MKLIVSFCTVFMLCTLVLPVQSTFGLATFGSWIKETTSTAETVASELLDGEN